MALNVKPASTSVILDVLFIDNSSGNTMGGMGTASGLTWAYRFQTQSTWTTVTILGGTLGTFASGSIISGGAGSNVTGRYQLCLPDASVPQVPGSLVFHEISNGTVNSVAMQPYPFTLIGDPILNVDGSNLPKVSPPTSGTINTVTGTVLLTAGTSAGQLDFTAGIVKSNLVQMLGAAITGTASLIVAAFTKFFNVSTPTGTLNDLPGFAPGATGGLMVAGGSVNSSNIVSSMLASPSLSQMLALSYLNTQQTFGLSTMILNNGGTDVQFSNYALLRAGGGGGGGGNPGNGAFTIGVTVTDNAMSPNHLQNVAVYLTLNSTTLSDITGPNGTATFNGNSGVYTIAAAAAGYSYGGGSLTVNGNTTTSLIMTALSFPSPTAPGTVLAYQYTYNINGTLTPGISVSYKQVFNDNEGIYSNENNSAVSDGNSRWAVYLMKGATYEFTPPSGRVQAVKIPDDASTPYALPIELV